MSKKKNEGAVVPIENQVQGMAPAQMLAMALDSTKEVDLGKVEKMMELQFRFEKNEAEKAFIAALSAFKANPPRIVKNTHVNYSTSKGVTDYKHATAGQVVEEIEKGLQPHGMTLTFKSDQDEKGRIKVTAVLTHILGHSKETSLSSASDQSGGKNSIQAIGSAVTYLKRYTALLITGLETYDSDDDCRAADDKQVETLDKRELSEILDLINTRQVKEAAFLKLCGVSAPEEITRDKFQMARTLLLTKPVK